MEHTTDYKLLQAQLQAIMQNVPYETANFANASALIWQALADTNWAGFYFMRDGILVLGPFQGKPACTRIAVGKGVCGTAVAQDKTQLVPDVHTFPGHIACDCASNSEIVVPIHKDGAVYGVLDIDSPLFDRFSLEDQAGLETLVRVLEEMLKSAV